MALPGGLHAHAYSMSAIERLHLLIIELEIHIFETIAKQTQSTSLVTHAYAYTIDFSLWVGAAISVYVHEGTHSHLCTTYISTSHWGVVVSDTAPT